MRIRNWDIAVIDWATRLRGAQFVWGLTDCGTLVRRMTTCMYGEDIFMLERWKSARAMKNIVEKAGGVVAILESVGSELNVRYASTGDVIVRPGGCPITGLDSVMPVVNSRVLLATPGEPLCLEPIVGLVEGMHAWRIHADR